MRRGIGVGHVQQKKQQRDTMADLGAMMTAERIARFADQLDELKRRLKELTVKHINDIECDAIVRAKFRQLADGLGVDFGGLVRGAAQTAGKSSSHTLSQLVASLIPGVGDSNQQQLHRLACEAIQGCIHERQYVGTYVPMDNIVRFLRRKYKSHGLHFHPTTSSSHSHRSVTSSTSDGLIAQEDVVAALKTVSCLGSGYVCVDIDGALYIQSVAGATSSSADALAVLSFVSKMHRSQQRTTGNSSSSTHCEATTSQGSSSAVVAAGATGRGHLGTTLSSRISLARRSVVHGNNDSVQQRPTSASDDVGEGTYNYSWNQLRCGFPAWPPHRLDAALNSLMHDGAVWIDSQEEPMAACPPLSTTSSTAATTASPSPVDAGGVQFWFVNFLLSDRLHA